MKDKKRKYAKFLLEGCLRLEKGDKLFIIGYDLIKEFIDLIIIEAKNLGVSDVKCLINSPSKQRDIYLSKTYEEIIKDPMMDRTMFNQMAKEGYAFLSLTSSIPDYYKEVDSELLNRVSNYQMSTISEYRNYQQKGLIKWNISAVPNAIWAKDLGLDIEKLWKYILDICLINEDNPIEIWNKKMKKLENRCKYLNELDIDYLVYENGLGTKLKVGLPKGYIFKSADSINIVNMPTEEVYTSPEKYRVNGRVYSSKMLVYNNKIIDDFWLEFKEGKVVDYDAKKGKRVLEEILATDEGARYLGEVAFVDIDSPISKSGIIFKNTLYDENGSCHLALGMGFSYCVKEDNSNNDELNKQSINYSKTHVDFFIGTKDLKITAVLQNGQKKVIMKDGNFKER